MNQYESVNISSIDTVDKKTNYINSIQKYTSKESTVNVHQFSVSPFYSFN